MSTTDTKAWLPIGTVITCSHGSMAGQYRVLRHHNCGTSSLVYQVQSCQTGQLLALKEFYVKDAERLDNGTLRIPENPEWNFLKNSFMSEPMVFMLSAAWCNDTHDGWAIPRSEVFSWQGNSYYLMDWAEGVSLFEWMKTNAGQPDKGRPVTLEQCFQILEQLAETVQRLHDKGCVHLDIAPQNIMIHAEHDGILHVTLVDFGLMRTLDSFDAELSLVMRGSPGFSDLPWQHATYEKILRDTRRRLQIKQLDIYALGAMTVYLCMLPYRQVIHERDDVHMRNFLHEMQYRDKQLWEAVADGYSSPKERSVVESLFRLAKQATDNNLDTRLPDAATFHHMLLTYR